MSAVGALLARDLRRILRQPSFLLGGLLAPVVLGALLAHVMPPWSDVFRASYVVADDDRGAPALAVLRGPIRDLWLTDVVDISRVHTEAELREAVRAGWAHAGLYIPDGFSAAVQAGRAGAVRIVASAGAGLESLILLRATEGFGQTLRTARLALESAERALAGVEGAPTRDELIERAAVLGDAITAVDVPASDRRAAPRVFYSAAMAVLFAFVAAAFGAAVPSRERHLATVPRLLAAAVRPTALPVAALLLAGLLAGLSMGLAWASATILVGETWGDPVAVAALLAATAACAAGVGLLVAATCRDEERAIARCSIVAVALGIGGGVFLPVVLAPEPLALVWPLTPTGWFMEAIGQMAGGAGVAATATSIAVILAMGLGCAALGLVLTTRKAWR
jgi:ABC-2 type transport system permease protein